MAPSRSFEGICRSLLRGWNARISAGRDLDGTLGTTAEVVSDGAAMRWSDRLDGPSPATVFQECAIWPLGSTRPLPCATAAYLPAASACYPLEIGTWPGSCISARTGVERQSPIRSRWRSHSTVNKRRWALSGSRPALPSHCADQPGTRNADRARSGIGSPRAIRGLLLDADR